MKYFFHGVIVKRFAIDLIHASFDSLLLEGLLDMSGDSDDGRVFSSFLKELPDPDRCFDAVHHRHTEVSKDYSIPHSV